MILSGSCRRMERSPRAKVRPFFSLTGICSTPCSWYSTGSSMVTILSDPVCVSEIAAYKVVVLPLPVGPVTSSIPYGSELRRRSWVTTRMSKSKHVEPQPVQPLGERLLVEGAQHRVFAEDAGNHRDAEIDRTAVEGDAEAAVLRHAALGDVEFRHDLDARDDLLRHRHAAHRGDVHQDAVDAVAHGEPVRRSTPGECRWRRRAAHRRRSNAPAARSDSHLR